MLLTGKLEKLTEPARALAKLVNVAGDGFVGQISTSSPISITWAGRTPK